MKILVVYYDGNETKAVLVEGTLEKAMEEYHQGMNCVTTMVQLPDDQAIAFVQEDPDNGALIITRETPEQDNVPLFVEDI